MQNPIFATNPPIMQQLQQAQQQLSKILSLNEKDLKQASNKISDNVIKQHKQAQNKSQISESLIDDLSHQIYVLENIQKTGVGLQQNMSDEIQGYVQEYRRVREELVRSRGLMMNVEGEQQSLQGKGRTRRMKMEEGQVRLAQQIDNMDIAESIEPESHRCLDNPGQTLLTQTQLSTTFPEHSMLGQEKKKLRNKSIDKKKKRVIKRIAFQAIEYANLSLLLIISLYVIYWMLVGRQIL